MDHDLLARRHASVKTLYSYDSWFNSVAFSRDGTLVVSGSGDTTVKIWDATCLGTIDIGQEVSEISFDNNGLYLHTNVGTVFLDLSSASDIVSAVIVLQEASARLQFEWCWAHGSRVKIGRWSGYHWSIY